MQRNVFDISLQCQTKTKEILTMKTKDFLTVKELEFQKRVREKYEADIEEICFMAAAIRLEEMCCRERMTSKEEFQEKVETWAKRIKVIAERIDDLKI